MKREKEQYDDWIIEERWGFDQQAWRFMRIRDDNPGANHITNMIIEPVRQKGVRVLP